MSDVGEQRLSPDAPDTLWVQAAAAFTAWRDEDADAAPLVRLMTPVLWHVARACSLDEDAARDVLQTVWLALVRTRGTIADPRAVPSWLITATRREAWRIGRLTREQRRRAVDHPDLDLDQVVPPTPAAEDLAVVNDEGSRLWRAVGSLPERCQRLLRVVAFSDRPDYARLAEHLGMPVGSIGPTRGRCLAKLRALLDPQLDAAAGGAA